MRRWLFLLALLPNCTGCLYYGYPTLSYTPEQPVENRDGSAHAFRVDVDRIERNAATASTSYTLTRIPLDSRGLVPSQLEIAPASGVWDPLNVFSTTSHEKSDYTLTVRLYRPGYQTKEIKSWDKTRDAQWLKAETLAAQEKAVDDLLGAPDVNARATWWELKDEKTPGLGLQPGAASKFQRDTLVFAANEYQRLANSLAATTPNMQLPRERLQQKAIWLRRYAEQAQ